MKILIVDDDLELLGLIGFALRQAGYLVLDAADGIEALALFEREQPDLLILDVNLPKLSGFEVCRQVRTISATPVLLLTVRNSEEDQIYGLDLGADDYLTKPFSPRTLLARVRALLRRAGSDRAATVVAGALAIDPEQQSVQIRGGPPIRLTNREFRLLQYLLANAGHIVAAERLTNHVWGYQGLGDRSLLKQLVHRLRQKIERDPADPQYLVTAAGAGYMLRTERD